MPTPTPRRPSHSPTVRTTRTTRSTHSTRTGGTGRSSRDEEELEYDENDSHVYAVIQHARKVSAAEGHQLHFGVSAGAGEGGGGYRGGGYEVKQEASRIAGQGGRDDGQAEREGKEDGRDTRDTLASGSDYTTSRQDAGHTRPELEESGGFRHLENDRDDIRPSLDLDELELGMMQMQWAMPPDRSGIFVGGGGGGTATVGAASLAPERVGSALPISKKAVANTNTTSKSPGLVGAQDHGQRQGQQGGEGSGSRRREMVRNTFGASLGDGSLSLASSIRTNDHFQAPPSPLVPNVPDVPKDVDEDGRSIGNQSQHRQQHRHRGQEKEKGKGHRQSESTATGTGVNLFSFQHEHYAHHEHRAHDARTVSDYRPVPHLIPRATGMGEGGPSTATTSTFSTSARPGHGHGGAHGHEHEQRQRSRARGARAGAGADGPAAGTTKGRGVGIGVKRDKTSKSTNSAKSGQSGTSTRALYDGVSASISRSDARFSLSGNPHALSSLPGADPLPSPLTATTHSTSTALITTGSVAAASASSFSVGSKHARGGSTSKSFKGVVKRARESRWVVRPTEISRRAVMAASGDGHGGSARADEWVDAAGVADADVGAAAEHPGPEQDELDHEQANEHPHDQVGLLLYDGATSRHPPTSTSKQSDRDRKPYKAVSDTAGAGGEPQSRLDSLAAAACADKAKQREKEVDGKVEEVQDEISDLGLLVGRAAVLERILNAGKRISNTSLHHTLHRPYTPSRFSQTQSQSLSRSSFAQSFNWALGSAFGFGGGGGAHTYAYAASCSDGPRSSAGIPPTPRVPEHLLHLIPSRHSRKRSRARASASGKYLFRSASTRSNVTARTGRTWMSGRSAQSAQTAQTGSSGVSGHTARARRHVGRTMMRLTGTVRHGHEHDGAHAGQSRHRGAYDQLDEGYEDEHDDEPAREDDGVSPLPESLPDSGTRPHFDLGLDLDLERERDRQRLARRVQGDTDGWCSLSSVVPAQAHQKGGGDAASANRISGTGSGAESGMVVVVRQQGPAAIDPGAFKANPARGKRDGRKPAFALPTSGSGMQHLSAVTDPSRSRQASSASDARNKLVPSCTANVDLGALVHPFSSIGQGHDHALSLSAVAAVGAVGGRGIMAPPQCVNDSVIVSATTNTPSDFAGAGRHGQGRERGGDRARARSRTMSGVTMSGTGMASAGASTRHSRFSHLSHFSDFSREYGFDEKGYHHFQQEQQQRRLGSVREADEGGFQHTHPGWDGAAADQSGSGAGTRWKRWVRKRKTVLLIGLNVVIAGLLMLVGVLVGVLK